MQHVTIEIDGVRVFYREAGPRTAPVVLLPHGYPCSSFQYRPFMPVAGIPDLSSGRRQPTGSPPQLAASRG